jgi:NAD+ synthase (glutamine-hydrolysing)
MKLVRVAAAALNQTPLDWEGNQRRIAELLVQARSAGVSLLCLPEMCISGYGCEDAFHGLGVQRESMRRLLSLLPETSGMVVTFGLPVLYRKAIFNAVAVAVDGRLAGIAAKRNLAGDGIHYEPRWFKPWPAGERVEIEVGGERFPLGDLLFEAGGVRFGFEICEDAWVAERPGAALAREAVDFILNPSASHFAFGKLETRRRFVLEGSRAFGVGYVYANLLGNEAGRTIYDGGTMIAVGGRMVADGRRFGFGDWGLTEAVVDVDDIRTQQARIASFAPDLAAPSARTIAVPFVWPAIPSREESPREAPPREKWESSSFIKEEELARAVSLGLFDYVRKSRSKGFVVSLSGGCDSAAVVTFVAIMARLALADLGPAGVAKKLSGIPGLPTDGDPRALVRRLLLTAYQATASSSDTTREAARTVAAMAGAEHLELDVDAICKSYVEMISRAIGRPLDWEHDDLALQNVQARVRSPGIWLLANLRGALLLATSNRSEAAAGYATMDGDTSGGLSPIAGIDKAFLRHWLEWLETTGPKGIGPFPELAAVTRQKSTPELRPREAKQTSEADLMPFVVLDAIERLAIRDKLSPIEAWEKLRGRHPEVDPVTIACWVDRFYSLFARNQWKRERYAPSFHLDDENLDPKSWFRFPILSGGYAAELAELRRVAGV